MKTISKLFLIILLAGVAGSFLLANVIASPAESGINSTKQSIVINYVFAKTAAETAAEDLCKGTGTSCPYSENTIFIILSKAVRYTYTAFFIVAIIFIIIAAFSFLTAKGDPEAIKKARDQILWAVVAIAIALISVAAATIINTFITPTS